MNSKLRVDERNFLIVGSNSFETYLINQRRFPMSLKHYHEKGSYYFITTVTQDRNPIFAYQINAELLVNILTYFKFKNNYNISAFVIMPDHVHFIIQPLCEDTISDIMKNIKGNFSRFYNKLNSLSGTVFQKGYYDTVIKSDIQLNETIKYIHDNPIKKDLVSKPGEYQYSSYRYYYNEDSKFELLLKQKETFE